MRKPSFLAKSQLRPVAIILAGGESARMGRPKALLPTASGLRFIDRLVQTFEVAGCRTLVVTGADHGLLRETCSSMNLCANQRWEEGQFSSVRVGLKAALRQHPKAILIHPEDSPCLSATTVRLLLRKLSSHDAVIPTFRGKTGHPVAMSAQAARAILRSRSAHLEAALTRLRVQHVAVRTSKVLDNMNTPQAYRKAFGRAVPKR
jgi:molybdenum cofactor cytidylyltransferase